MSCCDLPAGTCSREEAMKRRFEVFMCRMLALFPSNAKAVDLWRPMEIRDGKFGQKYTIWIRLAENVSAFLWEKRDKFYQDDVGLVQSKRTVLVVPEGYELRPDDHVVIGNVSHLVIDQKTNFGIQELTIDENQSRFIQPARDEGVHRQMLMGAKIQ